MGWKFPDAALDDVCDIKEDGTINAVARAMDVLECLCGVGVASIAYLSAETRLPKASVLRILRTFVKSGLVHQSSPRADYRITSKLVTLGAGFVGLPAILEATVDLAEALTERFLWPVSIGQRADDAMVIRYSTIPHSPYAHTRSTVGKRIPIWTSAHGRAWLASISASSRPAPRPEDVTDALPKKFLKANLQQVASKGYAMRAFGRDPSTNSIAVPIRVRGEVLATLGMTFFARSLDTRGITWHADALKAAAQVASERLAAAKI